jgi:hypothetical protein
LTERQREIEREMKVRLREKRHESLIKRERCVYESSVKRKKEREREREGEGEK